MKKRLTARERREARAESDRQFARFRDMMAEGQRRAAERAMTRPAGLMDAEHKVALLLQTAYGISERGTNWLLREAPYRPQEAEGCDLPIPGLSKPLRVATAWKEDDIHAAARKFVAECQRATPTLWSHPRVKGRFKLRAAVAGIAERKTEAVV